MTTLLLLGIRGLAASNLRMYGTGALGLTALPLVLLLHKRFALLRFGHVAACVWGIVRARVLFVRRATEAVLAMGLVLFFGPAAVGIYRLFVQRREQTLA